MGSPCQQLGTEAPFSGARLSPGLLLDEAFWSVFAAGEAAPSSGSPHPLHPSWCPGFLTPGRPGHSCERTPALWPRAGAPQPPRRQAGSLQATSLQPVSGRLGVTRPRPSRWAKREGMETGLGRRLWGAGRVRLPGTQACPAPEAFLLSASWFMYKALYEAAGINDRPSK